MKDLMSRVCEATGLDEAAALPAIGHVLQFMREHHAPASNVAELVDKIPSAQQALKAAAATSDAGVTAAIGAVKGLFGFGHMDMNVLGGKLGNLGLSEQQAKTLLKEVFSYAELLVGKDGVAKLTDAMPHLSGFMKSAEASPREL